MTNHNIIRAWKDEEYRLSLTEQERASLPQHPAGRVELSNAALDGAAGGITQYTIYHCWITAAECFTFGGPFTC
jgi:mersacidin/lichenicidin family type 2 lantibiotic